jgi:hypothetical protein
MKQRIVGINLTALGVGVLAFFFLACSKGDPVTESNSTSYEDSGSTSEKSVWAATEKIYQGRCDSNGLATVLQLSGRSYVGEATPLTCDVCVINTSTNLFDWCWKGANTNLLKIELLNSNGIAVERTTEGLKYGTFLTGQQYETFFMNGKRPVHLRGYAFIPVHTGTGLLLARVHIPDLFKIKDPGEYTLQVQIRMGQMEFPERKLKRLIMPPEVTTKIQIYPESIPSTDSSSNGSTNTSIK